MQSKHRYLIVGQGIAGTLFSYICYKRKIPFLVIDRPLSIPRASMVAGAIINPYNLQKWELTPGQQQCIDEAIEVYTQIEEILGCSIIQQKSMLVFHANASEKQHFDTSRPGPGFTSTPLIEELKEQFNVDSGVACAANVWQINNENLMVEWRKKLVEEGLLIEAEVDYAQLQLYANEVCYHQYKSDRIVFCEGANAVHNPFLKGLPFVANRGEALLVAIPDLPNDFIYHKFLRLIPAGDSLFWCGSNYIWQFEDLKPDEQWRMQSERLLKKWLRVPFTIIDHIVAERPTTSGQVSFVGIHPSYPQMGILNGLGTRGFSQAPLLAKQLYHQFEHGETDNRLKKWLR